MNYEEIARRVSSLKLSSDKDKEAITIPEELASLGQNRLESCLVANILSPKAVNSDIFRTHMPRILQAKKLVRIEVIVENIFLLDFTSDLDRRHALSDGPWSFFKDLVVFTISKGLQKSADMVFEEIRIWVKCHNVPIAFMHSAIIRNIGMKIGRVLEVDAGDDGHCSGRFAHIRVSLNITQPLQQCIWIQTEQGKEEIFIILVYERLPKFCFNCGKLGHVVRYCNSHVGEISECKFGNWLRALVGFGERNILSRSLVLLLVVNRLDKCLMSQRVKLWIGIIFGIVCPLLVQSLLMIKVHRWIFWW